MKKLLTAILLILLCISLAGCGGDSTTTTTDSQDSQTYVQEEDVALTVEVPTEPFAYEITNYGAEIYDANGESCRVRIFIEIKNTGKNPVRLSSGSIQLQDTDGNDVAYRNMYSGSFPKILNSGEIGYYCESPLISEITGPMDLIVIPDVSASEYTSDYIRLEPTDVKIADVVPGEIRATCKVQNNTDEDYTSVYFAVALYDADDNFITMLNTFSNKVPAHQEVELYASSAQWGKIPVDITASTVARYVAYAGVQP